MLFEIKKCKVREVTDVTSGTSQSGKDWKKATVVIEQADGNYTETYAMQAFDDKIDVVQQFVGQDVDVKFTIRAREFNGRWYNDLRFQYVAPVQDGCQQTEPRKAARPAPAPQPAPQPDPMDDPDGDLPF